MCTGVTGQDGAYLAEFLLHKGYEVHGIKRRASLFNTERIDQLDAIQIPAIFDGRNLYGSGMLCDIGIGYSCNRQDGVMRLKNAALKGRLCAA